MSPRLIRVVPLLACALIGCKSPDGYTYNGYPMSDFFPFDGERSWTFASADAASTVELAAVLDPTPVPSGDREVRVVRYTTECLEDGCADAGDHHIRSISWDAGTAEILLVGYEDASGPQVVDPPLVLADDSGTTGDTWESEDGSVSTFVGIGACPIQIAMPEPWEDCLHLRLADASDQLVHPLHGDYYAISGYNVISMQLRDDPAQWELSNTRWTPTEN